MADASGLRKSIQRYAERRFTAGVAELIYQVRDAAPRDSGRLEEGVGEAGRSSSRGRWETTLVSPQEHASYQDQGTGIHGPKGQPIRARAGGVLAWEGRSRGSGFPGAGRTATGMIFATEVSGVRATGYWSNHVTPEGWRDALRAGGRTIR